MAEKLNIYQKMAAIQGSGIEILKNKKAQNHSYADLEGIMNALQPLLNEYKLLLYNVTSYDVVTQRTVLTTVVRDVENPSDTLQTVFHIKEDVALQSQNPYMVVGSAITYFRRYAITSLFNLTTDTDGVAHSPTKSNQKTVEESTEEKPLDFVEIFKGLINKKKPKETLLKSFEAYGKLMSPEQLASIKEMINNYDSK